MLKINIFTFEKKILKQKRGTAIGTKFAPLCSILFMAELEEEIMEESEYKPYFWWRYNDDIIFSWENKLKFFIDKINKVHPSIKFTAKWSQTSINFLDVTVSLMEELTETDLYVKPTDSHQYLQSSSLQSNCVTLSIVKRVYHIVILSSYTTFVQKLTLLTNASMIWKYFSRKEDTVLNWWGKNTLGKKNSSN